MSSDAPDEFFSQLLSRLEGLQTRLAESESQNAELTVRNRDLSSNLEISRMEAKSAREELTQEVTKNSILDQQLSQATQARDQAVHSNAHQGAQHSAMDSTLTLVQRQLSQAKSNLSDLSREKEESTAYYESMLVAKETSLSSLQQLMENLKRAHTESLEVYEEQLNSLRAAQGGSGVIPSSLIPASRRGNREEHAAQADHGRREREEASRVSELEALLSSSSSKLEQMSREIKERDKLLQRAERKIQELNHALSQQRAPQPSPPGHTSHTFEADAPAAYTSDRRTSYDQKKGGGEGGGAGDHLSPSRPLKDALRLLKHASLDKREMQAHLELIQSSFAEERRRREASSSQLLYQAEESRLLAKKLAAEQELTSSLRAEVNGLKERLVAASNKANMSIDVARKESEVLTAIKIETLTLEIDRMRVRHEESLRAAESLHRQKLSTEVEGHRARVRALEDELSSATSAAAAASASLNVTKDQQSLSLNEHRTLLQQRLDQHRAQSAREIDEMRKESRSQLDHKERELRSWYELKLEQASQAARSHSHEEREEALKEVQRRCERLQAESNEASEQVHRAQRLVFLIRSHWGSLRKHLSTLHTSLTAPNPSSNPPDHSQGHKRPHLSSSSRSEWNDLLDSLMKDWDASIKVGGGLVGSGGIETTVEKSFAAASALVEAANEGLTSLTRSVSSSLDRAKDVDEEIKRVRSLGEKKIHDLDLELGRSIEAGKALIQKVASLEADLSHCQAKVASAQVESQRSSEALVRSEATVETLSRKLSEVESAKSSIYHSLRQAQGSHGALGSQLKAKDGELQARVNEVNDLRATIALLHQRIETQDKDTVKQLDELKAKLSALVAVAPAPDLLRLPNGPTAKAAEAQAALAAATANAAAMASSGGPAHIAALAHQSLRHLLSDSMTQATSLGPRASLPWQQGPPVGGGGGGGGSGGALVLAGGGDGGLGNVDSGSLSSLLEESLGRAQVEVQSFVARIGQIEVCHWELSRGLSGVERARGHLGSLLKELEAGRHSVALVLATEMVALIDSPTSSSSSSSHTSLSSSGGGLGGGGRGVVSNPLQHQKQTVPFDASKAMGDLQAARMVSMELATSAKTSETMLAGLAESLPGWLQLIQAESKSRYRQDLSRVRSVVDSKLLVLRRELKDLRESVSQDLRSASQQLLSLSSVALNTPASTHHQHQHQQQQPTSSSQATGHLGSMMVDWALAAALSADLVSSGKAAPGGSNEVKKGQGPSIPPPISTQPSNLAPNLLSQLDAERRAMARGLEGLISDLGSCLGDGVNREGPATLNPREGPSMMPTSLSPHEMAGGGGGGGMLGGQVQNLEGAIRIVRSEVLSVRRDKADLLSQLESIKHASEARELRARALKGIRVKAMNAISEAFGGLPPSLLASSLLLPFQSLEHPPSALADERSEEMTEIEMEAAESSSLKALEELRQACHGFLSRVQQAAGEEAYRRVHHEVIVPLEDQVEGLTDELDDVRKDLVDLQVQVRETLVAGDAALVVVREEAEEAAYVALDGALSVSKLEVQGALGQARELQQLISESWAQASESWSRAAMDQRGEAEAAVKALEGIMLQLQVKLRDHSLTLEGTREELSRAKKEQSSMSASFVAKEKEREEETTRLRLRVGELEKREGEMEAEARDLRRTIKAAQDDPRDVKALASMKGGSFGAPFISSALGRDGPVGRESDVARDDGGDGEGGEEEAGDYPWRKYQRPGLEFD